LRALATSIPNPVLKILVQILGIILVLAALTDVFLTVLYARIGTGIITPSMSAGLFRLFKKLARLFPRYRDPLLSFAGPTLMVSIVIIWVSMLILGVSLFIWPRLGTSIQSRSGPTPTDFITAITYSGNSLTTAGNQDLSPTTPGFRMITMLQSLMGICVITLTITYLLEVYSALQRRNTFALGLHHSTGATADAVEMILGLGASGDFSGARRELGSLGVGLLDLYESHHFFWVLTYFRFGEPYYALSRIMLVILDCISLIRSALSESKYSNVVHSGAVGQLWNSSMHLLKEFTAVYLPQPPQETPPPTDPLEERQWRLRYREALMKLRGAGIATAEDESAGEEQYITIRREWDRYIRAGSEYMMHTMEEIDLAGAAAGRAVENLDEPRVKLRAAG